MNPLRSKSILFLVKPSDWRFYLSNLFLMKDFQWLSASLKALATSSTVPSNPWTEKKGLCSDSSTVKVFLHCSSVKMTPKFLRTEDISENLLRLDTDSNHIFKFLRCSSNLACSQKRLTNFLKPSVLMISVCWSFLFLSSIPSSVLLLTSS